MRTAAYDVDDTVLDPRHEFCAPSGSLVLAGKSIRINPTFKPTGDTIINLREAVGSINPATGLPWGRDWDYQCKVTRELSFEQHLQLQYEDVLDRLTIAQAIELAVLTMRPKPGARSLMRKLLQWHKIESVFVTNGADLIAAGVLTHFFGDILGAPKIIANRIVNGRKFEALHGADGLEKHTVIRELKEVVLFAGDSARGDGLAALETVKMGGKVIAVGRGHECEGSLAHFCKNQLHPRSWSYVARSFNRRRRYI